MFVVLPHVLSLRDYEPEAAWIVMCYARSAMRPFIFVCPRVLSAIRHRTVQTKRAAQHIPFRHADTPTTNKPSNYM